MPLFIPPDPVELIGSLSTQLAIFNTLCLVAVIIWWRIVDEQLFRENYPRYKEYSAANRKRALSDIRENYFYYQKLPLFVDRSPLRQAMYRGNAPSLGPVLAVAVGQALPVISVFIAFWYAIHAIWHIGRYLTKKVKAYTPEPVKRLLFTPWF